MRTLQGFEFCDTVEIRFYRKECPLNGYTIFDEFESIKGFTFYYVLDVDSNTFDSFYILDVNDKDKYVKFSSIVEVLTCRMVLFEKILQR